MSKTRSHDRIPTDLLTRVLRLFSDVRPGEAITLLLMLANIFLVLVAYYVVKTVREPLVLATGGAEIKSYAAAVQAVLLMGLVPFYSWFSAQVSRLRLVWGVTLFFMACIEGFYLAAKLDVPYLGVAFFVWVGIFSLMVIAQFWSFANDIYSRQAGERLFPVIAVGMTAGAVVGARLSGSLFDLGVGAYELLQVAAVLLAATLGLYTWIDRRQLAASAGPSPKQTLGDKGGFTLVARSPYLRLVALLLILANLVNTTGEYILGRTVLQAAEAAAAVDSTVQIEAYIGAFYGDFFFWVNLGTVLVQALLVSRIVKYLGIGGVVLALPVVALGTYGLIAGGVGLGVLRWAKTAENLTDYSVMNTAKAMLWLPTTRDEKYKAKAAIDTFFVRLGDVVSAGLVFAGTALLSLGVTGFAMVNLVIIGAWGGVAWLVLRQYKRLAASEEAATSSEG